MRGKLQKTLPNAIGIGLSFFPRPPFSFPKPVSWQNMKGPQLDSQ